MQETHSTANPSSETRAKTIRALGPVFIYFLAAGLATVMLGPLLPSLIQHWQILDEQAGALFTANFLGQLCGAWFAARNLRGSVIYGAALTAAGCVAMVWVNFALAPIAFFCIGLGLGAGLTAGNVIVGTAISSSRARLIAMLNVAWSIGAIACPVLVRLSASGGIRRFFFLTAACLLATSLCAIAIPRQIPRAKSDEAEAETAPSSRTRLPLPPVLLVVFGTSMLLYVGVENALGGWLPSYAVRTNPSLRASSIALYFWIAELVGRLLVAALSVRIGEATLYRLCLALLILTELVLCMTTRLSPTNMIALAILSGLALAPLYPLLVAFMLAVTGNHPRLGALFACSSIGGAVVPWLTGVFSTQFHGLRAGLIVPAAGACVLLFLSTIVTRKPATLAEA